MARRELERPGRADRPAPDPGHEVLDVVADGGAIRLPLDFGSPPIVSPVQPMVLLQLGSGGLDPAAAAAQAVLGLVGGQVGLDALGQPGIVRAHEGACGRSAAALGLEGTRATHRWVRPLLDPAEWRVGVSPAQAAQPGLGDYWQRSATGSRRLLASSALELVQRPSR